MIDDAVLERLLAEAAAAVEVPERGPADVLAARDALAAEAPGQQRLGPFPPSLPRTVLLAAAVVAVAVAGLTVAAVRGGHPSPATSASGAVDAPAAVGGAASGRSAALGAPAGGGAAGGMLGKGDQVPAPAGVSSGGGATGSATSGAAAPASGGAAPAPSPVPAAQAQTVKTGTLSLVVPAGQVGATIDRLGAAAAGLGGYVQSSSASSGAPTPVVPAPGAAPPQTLPTTTRPPSSGTLVLRVPVTAFEALVTAVTRAGTATSVQTSGQDVTGQYVDLQARIASLTSERTAYQQILAKATSIGDVLSVEGQLTAVQTQIEQLQGQLNVLADQAGNSTLTVQVDEPSVIAAQAPTRHRSGVAKAWQHARSTFTGALEALLAASGGIAVALLVAAAVVVGGRLAWRVARRRML